MTDATYPNAAGHRGVDTSIAGAEHINRELPKLQRLVRAAVALSGERGATGDEIADSLGWDCFRVRPRTSELRAAGKIVDSGNRRKSNAGIASIVWVLPEYAPAKEGEAA